jgi:hypothetical protein
MTIFTEEFRNKLNAARNRMNRVEDRQVIELLAAEILRLEEKVRDQDKRISDYSWTINPDRMGGQFSQDEIDRSRNGGW